MRRWLDGTRSTPASSVARCRAALIVCRLLWTSGTSRLFLGSGANAFPSYYESTNLEESPHNIVLELGAEFGVVTVAVFTIGSLWLLRRYIKFLLQIPRGPVSHAAIFCALTIAFWITQYPLMGISSAKYASAVMGLGLSINLWYVEGESRSTLIRQMLRPGAKDSLTGCRIPVRSSHKNLRKA